MVASGLRCMSCGSAGRVEYMQINCVWEEGTRRNDAGAEQLRRPERVTIARKGLKPCEGCKLPGGCKLVNKLNN